MLEGDQPQPLRGAAARIVANMEASLQVPTATSVRSVPAKLLEVNRQILNNHLARTRGGKVSFTHLIGYAVLRALQSVPNMNSSFGVVDGKPAVVRHTHVNLGLAIDMQKDDGSRTLLVPNIKDADTLDFAAFHAAYEEIIRKARTNKLTVDDFTGTTVSITNPGTIGTEAFRAAPDARSGRDRRRRVHRLPDRVRGRRPADARRDRHQQGRHAHEHLRPPRHPGRRERRVPRLHPRAPARRARLLHELFASFGVPYEPARWGRDHKPVEGSIEAVEKALAVKGLINMYRVRGHLIANLDPLGPQGTAHARGARPHQLGSHHLGPRPRFPHRRRRGQARHALRDILGVLRDAYSRTIGVEYMHIQEPDEKAWIQRQVEGVHVDATADEKLEILASLNAAEAFERFLHTKYLGQKRFSLEGAETLVPMLQFLLDEAADAGMEEVAMGMSHRGRLNVLANVVGKSYGQIFREFEGELDPNVPQGSGDVKYHVGATGKHTAPSGKSLTLTLAANPSHLEAVDPVVEGMVRAKQDRAGDRDHEKVLSVLIHGDAAFAGQGVVAETLNLSELPGYDVGGTVHVVVNNQVGFTTPPDFGRSTVYATDIAKAVQAPIFHVNGDDPEAAVRVIRLAFAFRQEFKKDVVVDMICYRRYGHNEGDEPAFTQPRMYEVIGRRRSVRKLYTETLVNRGDLTLEQCELALEDFRSRLEDAFVETQAQEPAPVAWFEHEDVPAQPSVETGVTRERLNTILDALVTFPPDFTVHPKLERILKNRRTEFDDEQGRLGARREPGLRVAAARGHARARRGAGHPPRHLQSAARHARRQRDGVRVHAARAHPRCAGAVHDLRLRALRIRGARIRVRLLGGRPRRARVRGKRSSATS